MHIARTDVGTNLPLEIQKDYKDYKVVFSRVLFPIQLEYKRCPVHT